jgi:DNA-binding CsgD family transcriptional regulator
MRADWSGVNSAAARIDANRQVNEELAAAALTWLDLDSQARVMVDRNQALLWSNEPADVLLAHNSGIEVRAGALIAKVLSRQGVLNAFIREAGPDRSTLCLSCTVHDQFLLLRARQIDDSDGRIVGLELVATETFRAVYADLDVAFGVTNAEHRVLLDLLDGNDALALAARHQVSIETTRSHIRSIYAKLGVTSREQLFNRARPFRI